MQRDDARNLPKISDREREVSGNDTRGVEPKPRSDFGGDYRMESQRYGYDVGTAGYDSASVHAQDEERHLSDKTRASGQPERARRDAPTARSEPEPGDHEAD